MEAQAMNELVSTGRFLSAAKACKGEVEQLGDNLTPALLQELAARMREYKVPEVEFSKCVKIVEHTIYSLVDVPPSRIKKEYRVIGKEEAGIVYWLPVNCEDASKINYKIAENLNTQLSDSFSDFFIFMVVSNGN
ncbi:hypothetical protein [Chromobacterium piscinae]|uniref:hypothetical protein n=1 Tax=Chromobacterium piscinae TaxID=686831 RepID=UPI00320A7E9A